MNVPQGARELPMPPRAERLVEVAEQHGWTVELDWPSIEGCDAAVSMAVGRELDDGRLWVFGMAYGRNKRTGRWAAMLVGDTGQWRVVGELIEPTVLESDLTRMWRHVSDLEWWLPRFGELEVLLREEGHWPERRTYGQRIREAITRVTS